jgi:release factor glutamine methyltransferase
MREDDTAPRCAPFMGLDLDVTGAVLHPRAETELLCRHALMRIATTPDPLVLDIGCGSGNLALAIAALHTGARVFATDITGPASETARRNAARLGLDARVRVMQGDMFAPLAGLGLEGRVDLVVCNPPYISTGRLEGDRRHLLDHEPREAFDGGPYGIAIHQRLVAEALPFLRPGGWLAFEFGEGQDKQALRLLQRQDGYEALELVCDAEQRPRVAIARKPTGAQILA